MRTPTEPGHVYGGTPWMDRALATFRLRYPEDLAAVEARIPEGHWLVLTCGRTPRPLGAMLVSAAGIVARTPADHHSVGNACSAALRLAMAVAS